jgi:hypothetical protein
MIINSVSIVPYVPSIVDNQLTDKEALLSYIRQQFKTNGISPSEYKVVKNISSFLSSIHTPQIIGNIKITYSTNLDDYPNLKITWDSQSIPSDIKSFIVNIAIGGQSCVFIVDKYSYTLNQQRRCKNTLEMKSLTEDKLEKSRTIYPTSLSGKISINTLLSSYGVLLNGPDHMIKIAEGGETSTLREKIEDSLKHSIGIINYSDTITFTKLQDALAKKKPLNSLNIISEITVEDIPYPSDNNLDPVIVTYDADKNGLEDVDTLGEIPTLKELEYESSTITYGDDDPNLPPESIKKLNVLTHNWDITGETKVKVTETYEGTRLIQKKTQTYGFAYTAKDIAEKDIKTGVYTLNGLPLTHWKMVGEEITTYEYFESFYTGSLTEGWRLERFEIEYLTQNKLPSTVSLWEQKANTDPNDTDAITKLNEELEKYDFFKIPFFQYEKLTLEPLYYYYTDIDSANSIVQFNGRNNSILYTINPLITPEYFVSEYQRGKYGVEMKTIEGKKISYLAFTGTEEKEIEKVRILESVNTNKNGKAIASAPVASVKYIEYQQPLASVSNTEVKNGNLPKEDKYAIYKYFFSSQHGEGLYSHIRRASNNVTFGRPSSVSISNPEKEFYLKTQGYDDEYYSYKSSILIGTIQTGGSQYNVKFIETFGEATNEDESDTDIYYPIIYLNQLPTTKLFFNVTTKDDAKIELKNYFLKQYIYAKQEKITFTALTPACYTNEIVAGSIIVLSALNITAIVETAEYNYVCQGFSQVYGKNATWTNPAWTGTVSITAMLIPKTKIDVKITSLDATSLIKSKITIPLATVDNGVIKSQITEPNINRRGS